MDLTELEDFIQREGILRIARLPKFGNWSVAIEGDILGTGTTLEEAYDNAARQRDYELERIAA